MAPSPTIRRLLKETSELSSTSKNPNPAFHAAPVSEADLHEWHFTLLGPPSPSPYAGGMYHGRISLPPSYPLKPPNFRFLTPSGRFEVNREICLSISGFHEETWMPAWGVRTALTALRSFMAESGTAGQVGGLEASKEVRERLARESRSWKCAECGARSNEEVMTEWWEACAAKGVKVGEDVGLEVLPEGLSLEAKIPRGAVEEQGKIKKECQPTEPTSNVQQSTIHSKAGEEVRHNSVSTSIESNSKMHSQISETQPNPSQVTSPSPGSAMAHSQPQPQAISSTSPNPTNPSSRPIPAGLRQLPIMNHPQAMRQRQDDTNTVTIDRAIYVVFVALLLMCIKKIFYPAARSPQWEDYAVVRE